MRLTFHLQEKPPFATLWVTEKSFLAFYFKRPFVSFHRLGKKVLAGIYEYDGKVKTIIYEPGQRVTKIAY